MAQDQNKLIKLHALTMEGIEYAEELETLRARIRVMNEAIKNNKGQIDDLAEELNLEADYPDGEPEE